MLRTTMAALQGTCHTATPSEKWGNCQRQYTASYVVTSPPLKKKIRASTRMISVGQNSFKNYFENRK